MLPKNSWCFDLEIVNAILNKGEQPLPGIRYCKGWGDHAGMGISVLVAARVDGSDVRTFLAEDLGKFNTLIAEAEMVIGHNSRMFDAKVLAAYGIYIPINKHLDFYHEVKLAAKSGFPRGYGLNALSERCGGPSKTEDGAMAPVLWQQGQHTRVIDYCENDIKMTCAVAQYYILNDANLPTPDKRHIRLRMPMEIKNEA